jgi:hypothetical protein
MIDNEKLREINGDAHASTQHRIETRLPQEGWRESSYPRKYAITHRVV